MSILKTLLYKAYFYALPPAEQVEECKLKRSWIKDNLKQASAAAADAATAQTPVTANPAPNPVPVPVPVPVSVTTPVQESCTDSVQKPAQTVDVAAVKKAIVNSITAQHSLVAHWLEAYMMNAPWMEDAFLYLVRQMQTRCLPYATLQRLPPNMVKTLEEYLNKIDPAEWEATAGADQTSITLYLADARYKEIE